jgi:hypothetical protein
VDPPVSCDGSAIAEDGSAAKAKLKAKGVVIDLLSNDRELLEASKIPLR